MSAARPHMLRARAALCASLASLIAAMSAQAQVTVALRGGAPDRTVGVATPLDGGLELRAVVAGKGEVRELIPWDEVRGVTPADLSSRHPADAFMAMATELWRARIRIARHDATLARPLLERYWDKFRAADGPTAQLVAEGLLRSAVDAGDLVAAVGPWIACLRLGSDGTPTRFPTLEPMLDDATGLLPGLSPFAPSSMRDELVKALDACAAPDARAGASLSPSAATAATVAAQMSRLTRIAGAAPTGAAPKSADAPASRALAAIEAIAAAPDARACERALAEFDRQYPDAPAFLGAWRHAAAGTNAARLARAAKPEARVAALTAAALENLAVPASGLDKTGLVDAYALEEAERLMREAGDTTAADALAVLARDRLRESAVRPRSAPQDAPAAKTNDSKTGRNRTKRP